MKSEFWEPGLCEILLTGGWLNFRRDPCCIGVYFCQQNLSCLSEKDFAIKMTTENREDLQLTFQLS